MKLFAILILLSTCSAPSAKQSKKSAPENQTANGIFSSPKIDTMTVTKDSEFVIEIRASLGSGYQWMLEDSVDKQYITLISSVVKTDSIEIAERPDLQIFTFKALKTGGSHISFIYRRPWKKKIEQDAERKKYYINII
jgi:predicted secreted protein